MRHRIRYPVPVPSPEIHHATLERDAITHRETPETGLVALPSPAPTSRAIGRVPNMSRIMRGTVSNMLALVAGPLTVSGHVMIGVVLIIVATALAVTISRSK